MNEVFACKEFSPNLNYFSTGNTTFENIVHLSLINHPQIEGAYILRLRTQNFVFLFVSGPLVSEGPDTTIGSVFIVTDG